MMRRYKAAYVGATLFAGFGCVAANFVYPGDEWALFSMGWWLLAVLTFPLGSIASAIGVFLIVTGAMTPLEAIFATTPVYAILGYVQWWRLLPAIYRKRGIDDLKGVFS